MKLDNESVLREILEQSLAGYWDWDIPSGNEYLSPSFKKMFGYEDHEIENRADSWQKLIYQEDLPRVFEKYNQHVASKGKIPYYIEVRYHHKNGSTIWVICSGRVIEWDDNGNAKRMIGSHIDITGRKKVEEELQLQKLYVTTILENQPGLVWLKDSQGRFLATNRAFAVSCGLDEPQLLYGKNDLDIWSYDLAQKYRADDEAVMKEGKQKTVEELIADKGKRRWFETFKSPVRNEQGRIVGTTGYARDITERKRAEEALRKSEEKYRTLIETTNTGYVFIDENGFVLDANEEYVRLSGHDTLKDIVGRNVIEWTAEADREKNARGVKSCYENGAIRNFEINYTNKNGTVTPIEINATCLSVAGKMQIITLCRDLSDRKRTDEALANAQKLESLGLLAGGIAHDFNNLMGGIFGYAELAGRTSTEEEVKQDLAMVMQTIGRARALTQQLLTFAKGGSPIQEVSPLFPFIQQTAQFALSGSNAVCRFDIQDGVWSANYDKNQIGQVIDNIIINAQQAMPLGGIIVLSARNVTLADNEHPLLKKGDYVRLSVTDTGVGIPKELQKRIFDPFFTTKTKGHGLGLATSYSIINRHGGCIDVYSEQGKGSTFNVYLPAVRETVSSSTNVPVKKHQGNGTFLVMDDEDVIRKAVSSMLRASGYNVVCTVNGQEAIDYVASEIKNNRTPAGMLFDLTVPGAMGGKEAIEQIRKMGVDIPAFVASGYADDPIIRNPAAYGFSASICKPFMVSELIEMLEKHMHKKSNEGTR